MEIYCADWLTDQEPSGATAEDAILALSRKMEENGGTEMDVVGGGVMAERYDRAWPEYLHVYYATIR
jgi:hypothetical protein